MKKSLLALSILACSSVFAATEISPTETANLKSLGDLTVTQKTVNSCVSEISRRADAKGADFYVIKSAGSVGSGAQMVVTAELFSK
ncbi:YdgH/BhsA/McbA-like domain containing protein [Citrobacter amalonaticus]|uniref:YdgH/BhsA/McbA-like domain containing protein n=1 Tax=Citrobacter farmeri TaxID=67824 RepID=UPI00189D42AB|nr:YdgH/BhsA/McbA-like domain containing protein [Citrobacter farmeri]MDB2166958.1 DUF1471 domain-containing protein [Citrobacter farmeri]